MRRLRGFPILFVVGFLLLQAAWVLTVPPFRGSDEFDHVYRAAGVASGQWVLSENADNGRGQLVEVSRDLADAASAQCASLTYTGHDNCYPAADAGDGRVLVATGAGSYHPLFYLVVGAAAAPFDGTTALYVMRATTALLCLVLLGAAAWAAHRRGSWGRAGVVLALTPVVGYTSVVVAPNGLEISAGLALWTALLALGDDDAPVPERGLFWLAVVAASVLTTLRLLGPVFVLLVVGSVALLCGERLWRRARAAPRRTLAGVAVVGLATLGSAGWILSGGQLETSSETGDNLTTWGPGSVVLWALQSIAAFPFRDQPGPLLVYPVVGGLALALWVAALVRARRRDVGVLVVVLTVTLLLPAVITALTIAAQGNIWQGRYGLPYGVGFVLVAAWVVARRRPDRPPPRRVLVPAALAWTAVTAACLLKVRHLEAGRAVSVTDPGWWVPWPVVVVALVVVGAGLQLLWVVRGQADDRA